MNLRERFLEVMVNFNPGVTPPKWEFGYWGATIDNWYREGLPRCRYPVLPRQVTTPTASLYNRAWHSVPAAQLPAGIAVTGGGLYWPTQNFPLDNDVRSACGMDRSQVLVNVNLLFYPLFEPKVLAEDDQRFTYIDIDGVTRTFHKETGVIPTSQAWPVRDRTGWEKLKSERLNRQDITGRLGPHWAQLVRIYKDRDFPLVLGGYPHGYFGTLAHLMGYENLFLNYYDRPELIHDIQATFTDLWLAVYEEVLARTDIDLFVVWEDISAGRGSMVSPALIREFMVPYYKRLTGFLKEHGVKVIFIDTDGDCFDLIGLFKEAGVTGMYPIEASCGMDIVRVRREFPDLQLMGGLPKLELARGRQRIDQVLAPVAEVLKTGGYIPFADHLIPPEVHWPEFGYYRRQLNRLLERRG